MASATFAAHPFDLEISIQQLVTPFCDSMDGKVELAGNLCVAATSDTQRFQTGVQSALLLVEQAHEEKDGRTNFMGQDLRTINTKPRLDFQTCEVLSALHFRRSGKIDVLPLDHFAVNAALPDQGQQRFFDFAPYNLSEL